MPAAMMAQHHYSFPVVTGLDPQDPPASRKARMASYQRLLAELDSNGQHLSEQISEIDLTDSEDARVLMPEQGTDILAHFGADHFLERYQRYKAHIAEWRQQYPNLAAVDLRYEQQVVLEMAHGASAVQPTRLHQPRPPQTAPPIPRNPIPSRRTPPPPNRSPACMPLPIAASPLLRKKPAPSSRKQARDEAGNKQLFQDSNRSPQGRCYQSSHRQRQGGPRQEEARGGTASRAKRRQTEACVHNPPFRIRGGRPVSAMSQKQDNLIVVLDIGSAWTRVLAADLNEGSLRYRGHGIVSSRPGMRKGLIAELGPAFKAVKAASERAERVARINIDECVVGVGGPHIRGLNTSDGIDLGTRMREITREDVRNAVERARSIERPARSRDSAPAPAPIHPRRSARHLRPRRHGGHAAQSRSAHRHLLRQRTAKHRHLRQPRRP
jgi:hypothetical protein